MNEKTNKKRRSLIFVLAIVLVIALLGGGLLAKYASQNRQQAQMISAGFHISSNYLKEGANPPEYNVPDWGNGVTVSIFNYELENVAQISEVEIGYTVSVTNGSLDEVTANARAAVEPDEDGVRTLPAGPTKTEHVLHITPDGNGDMTVTVKAVQPYEKTLTATLKIVSKNLPDYTIADRGDGTVLLTIKSNDYAGDVTVKWDPLKLSPDNTNELMQNWMDTQGSTGRTITTEDNSTYFLLFIKNTTETIDSQNGSATTITLG